MIRTEAKTKGIIPQDQSSQSGAAPKDDAKSAWLDVFAAVIGPLSKTNRLAAANSDPSTQFSGWTQRRNGTSARRSRILLS